MNHSTIQNFIGLPDFFLIVILIAIPLSILLYNIEGAGQKVSPCLVVYTDGKIYGRYDFDEPAIIEVGDSNILEIKDGKAKMIYADCADQVCVHSAALGKDSPGHIVCLPNRIVVSVENSENPLDIDGYVS